MMQNNVQFQFAAGEQNGEQDFSSPNCFRRTWQPTDSVEFASSPTPFLSTGELVLPVLVRQFATLRRSGDGEQGTRRAGRRTASNIGSTAGASVQAGQSLDHRD